MLLKRACPLLLLFLGACPSTPEQSYIRDYVNRDLEFPTNQVQLYIAQRNVTDYSGLDSNRSDGFSPLDLSEQFAIGIEFSEIIRDTIGWEIGIFYSQEEDVTRVFDDTFGSPQPFETRADAQLLELTLGGRYTYTASTLVQPYFGAGIDLILADLPLESLPEGTLVDNPDPTGSPPTGTVDAIFFRNSTEFLVGGYSHIGVNVRFGHFLLGVDGRALFFADDGVNYVQGAVTLGWAF